MEQTDPSAEALASSFLRETASLATLRLQAAAVLRRREDDALRAHLERAERRVKSLGSELSERSARPPRAVVGAFRLAGGATGLLTSAGGGERTLRAIGEGAKGLGRHYCHRLDAPAGLPPEVLFRLSQNYREALLLLKWVEDRLTGTPSGDAP